MASLNSAFLSIQHLGLHPVNIFLSTGIPHALPTTSWPASPMQSETNPSSSDVNAETHPSSSDVNEYLSTIKSPLPTLPSPFHPSILHAAPRFRSALGAHAFITHEREMLHASANLPTSAWSCTTATLLSIGSSFPTTFTNWSLGQRGSKEIASDKATIVIQFEEKQPNIPGGSLRIIPTGFMVPLYS